MLVKEQSMFRVLINLELILFRRDVSQAGGFPEPEIIHYNPKEFDFGKKKSFPFRDQVSKFTVGNYCMYILKKTVYTCKNA